MIRSMAVGKGCWLGRSLKQVQNDPALFLGSEQSADGIMSKKQIEGLRPMTCSHHQQRQVADAMLLAPLAFNRDARVHWRIKLYAPSHWLAAGYFHIEKEWLSLWSALQPAGKPGKLSFVTVRASSIRREGQHSCKASDFEKCSVARA